MLMPILPITVEQMPTNAFSKHIAVFIDQMLQGLKSMHDLEFAHMDVKPSNIAIRHDGSFVLIDLGSTAKFGTQTQTTLSFVPKPFKQASGTLYSSRPEHDYWMLATTLYDRLHDVPVVGSGTGDFLEVEQVLTFLKACLPE
jgi:serine/threonine protein kinase